MALEQLSLETGLNKVDTAIALLQAWEPPEGYYLAFSGGKDSVAIYDLAQKAGVRFDAHYCVSPIDPPQIYKFIKEHYPDVIWDYHARGFWKMVDDKGLPMRNKRWCCQYIKEAGGDSRIVITGNRRAEGGKRRNQCFVEVGRSARNKGKTFIRPIINFDNYDIWQYIRENSLPYCDLYDKGFERLGCILCPFDRHLERSVLYFPKTVNLWRLSCERAVRKFKERNYTTKTGKSMKHHFETGEELYQWWTRRR